MPDLEFLNAIELEIFCAVVVSIVAMFFFWLGRLWEQSSIAELKRANRVHVESLNDLIAAISAQRDNYQQERNNVTREFCGYQRSVGRTIGAQLDEEATQMIEAIR